MIARTGSDECKRLQVVPPRTLKWLAVRGPTAPEESHRSPLTGWKPKMNTAQLRLSKQEAE
jgi:hypothetical protein